DDHNSDTICDFDHDITYNSDYTTLYDYDFAKDGSLNSNYNSSKAQTHVI
ncbi:21242_t:CDS:1, partial [Dentiscutata erythropus]